MKRVLVITSVYYGEPWREGVINITRRLAQYLTGKGDQVTIITPSRRGESGPAIGAHGEDIVYVASLDAETFGNRVRYWRSVNRCVRRMMRGQTPDVVLAFASASPWLGPRVLRWNALVGSRLVLYITGLGRPGFGRNWLVGRTETLVGSPFLLRWFPHATVGYPVPSVQLLRPSSPSPRSKEHGLSLLYLGTAEKERGVEYLLRGISEARLLTTRPLRLTLALNGIGKENEDRIRRLISELDLSDIVTTRGVVDINEAYADADVVVIPRQADYRMSFPVRIVEALSCNKPLIVTSMCGMGELVDGCGLTVDPADPHDLARAITRIADEPGLHATLAARCPEVLERYAPMQTLKQLHALLERVSAAPERAERSGSLQQPGSAARIFLNLPNDSRERFPRINSNKTHRLATFGRFVRYPPRPVANCVATVKETLGLRSTGIGSLLIKLNRRRLDRTPLDRSFRTHLTDTFRQDVEQLSALLHADLSAWHKAT